MKVFKTSLEKVANSENIRIDFGMRYVDDILEFDPFKLGDCEYTLADYLEVIKSDQVPKGDVAQEEMLIELSNINKRYNVVSNCETVNSIDSDKVVLKEGDIVISKMTPKLGTLFLNLEHKRYVGSTELIEYKIKSINPLVLFYLLTTPQVLSVLGYLESGKNQRRVNPSDLLRIKMPKVTVEITAEIIKKNEELKDLMSKQKSITDVIDSVFRTELDIKNNTKKKCFSTSLESIAVDESCRFSYRNQNYYNCFEYKKLDINEWKPMAYLFDVQGGKRIPKGEAYSQSITKYYYLRPQEMLDFKINKEEMPNISESIYNGIKQYNVDSGSFCISIVGTLGKICYIDLNSLGIEEGNLIMSENLAKLVPKRKINSLFYNYYFRSYVFQKQIEREYTITTTKKLGLYRISKLAIPVFNNNKIERIINDIEKEEKIQSTLQKEIENKRDEIDLYLATELIKN